MATFLRGFEEKGLKNDRPGEPFTKEKKKSLFSFCDVCNIQLNSAAQAQVHYDGKSHRKRVKQLSDGQPPPPAQGSVPLLASPYPCPCPCPGPGPGPGPNTSTGRKQALWHHCLFGTMVLLQKREDLEQSICHLKTASTI